MEDSTECTFDHVFVVVAEYGVAREVRAESGRERFLLLSVPDAYRGVCNEGDWRRSAAADGVLGGRKRCEWRPCLPSAFGTWNGPTDGDREFLEGERAETAMSW
jgi:hypothetical protein